MMMITPGPVTNTSSDFRQLHCEWRVSWQEETLPGRAFLAVLLLLHLCSLVQKQLSLSSFLSPVARSQSCVYNCLHVSA